MVKLAAVKPGDKLFDVHRVKLGNTTIRTNAVYPVVVHEVLENGVVASWNFNAKRFYHERSVERWRRTEPARRQQGQG